MEILSYPEARVPSPLRAQVRELQDQAWPPAPGPAAPVGAPVHDPVLRPLSLLLVEEGRVLAALDILSKEITHAGRSYLAGGLSTVVTRRELRGRGHGRHLVSAARELMAARGLDLGLFTCDRPLRPFYESAGWRCLPGAVLVGGTLEAPFPSDRPGFDKVTMAAFFSAGGRTGEASFHGSRIELHPGETDRLW
ncbi:GNAT family N-acetyltransferase [Streptomyces sp. NPDC047022]|uniref:GNAT family N-acetyltransferase n=1 Tax=Streptomyces sp. NPDC047022 TaxID=3155737 RepID=UPI0033CB39AD